MQASGNLADLQTRREFPELGLAPGIGQVLLQRWDIAQFPTPNQGVAAWYLQPLGNSQHAQPLGQARELALAQHADGVR